jgi:hypothetical protein
MLDERLLACRPRHLLVRRKWLVRCVPYKVEMVMIPDLSPCQSKCIVVL